MQCKIQMAHSLIATNIACNASLPLGITSPCIFRAFPKKPLCWGNEFRRYSKNPVSAAVELPMCLSLTALPIKRLMKQYVSYNWHEYGRFCTVIVESCILHFLHHAFLQLLESEEWSLKISISKSTLKMHLRRVFQCRLNFYSSSQLQGNWYVKFPLLLRELLPL